MKMFLVVGILVAVFLVAVGITRFKEMREDSTAAILFLIKVSIPLFFIGSVVLLNYSSE